VSHTKLGFIRVWLTFVLPAVEVYRISKVWLTFSLTFLRKRQQGESLLSGGSQEKVRMVPAILMER
jgi:hypothetical protein